MHECTPGGGVVGQPSGVAGEGKGGSGLRMRTVYCKA